MGSPGGKGVPDGSDVVDELVELDELELDSLDELELDELDSLEELELDELDSLDELELDELDSLDELDVLVEVGSSDVVDVISEVVLLLIVLTSLLIVLLGNEEKGPVDAVIEVGVSEGVIERTVELELATSCDDSTTSVLLGSEVSDWVCDDSSIVELRQRKDRVV